MLHCTACRGGIAPFALHRPFIDKRCPKCAAQLRFIRRGRRRMDVEGPALPPVPAGVEVERRDARESTYRDQPTAPALRIRWKDPVGGTTRALVGLSATTTGLGVAGAIVLSPFALALSAIGVSIVANHVLPTLPGVGELVLEGGDLLARRGRLRRRGSIPASRIGAIRVVELRDRQSVVRGYRVLARLSTGEWIPVAQPRSSDIAHYVAAVLRQALEVDAD